MKTNFKGKEYNFPDYFILGLVEKGHLEKRGDKYYWTEKHFKRMRRSAKNLLRYKDYSSYRFLTHFWRFLKDIYRSTILPFF